MIKLEYCPYCGRTKKFECICEYGSLMKIKMEPSEKQAGLFHKRYCPKCGSSAVDMTCRKCSFSFAADDFWIARLW